MAPNCSWPHCHTLKTHCRPSGYLDSSFLRATLTILVLAQPCRLMHMKLKNRERAFFLLRLWIPSQKQEHRNLVKNYKLHFDRPVDQDQSPSAYFRTFKNIQALGRTEYTGCRESISVDSENKLWRGKPEVWSRTNANLARIC